MKKIEEVIEPVFIFLNEFCQCLSDEVDVIVCGCFLRTL
jgi:hypothetical protein